MKVVKTVCGMCGADNCGIDVFLRGDQIDQIVDIRGMREHPVNRGALCPQAKAAIELYHDPQRLRRPLRRTGDAWQEISWDEALDVIAAKLSALKACEGASALAVYQGRALLQFIRDGWVQRFMNLYGSPNLVRNEHMCAFPTMVAEKLTYGQPSVYGFDPEHVRCVLLWGSNPATSHIPSTWRGLLQAQKRGAKLIVVDPRRTRPAARADIHVAPRPGTDLALALGLIHVILSEALYDVPFVTRWTSGLDALAERVEAYTLAKVATITGVAAEDVRRIAHIYAENAPAYLDAGNALEHHSNAAQTLRAMMILRALTGNLDVPGGHVLMDDLPLADVTLQHKRPFGQKPLGAAQYPLFIGCNDFVPGDALVENLLSDKASVRAMIVGGGNPALTWPNTAKVQAALRRLDFLVVLDLHMTPTARLADIVLPMASPLEKTQLIIKSGPFGHEQPMWHVMLRKPVGGVGDCHSDWWFWHQLALKMGYGAYYPWSNVEKAIDFQLAPLGLRGADLYENPSGVYYGQAHAYRGYEAHGFKTPSGKVELWSHTLNAYGYDPLPVYTEPAESPVSQPELAERYPLVLNAGRRVAVYTHSRHRTLPSLRAKEPEPWAEIHPSTADAYGIGDGDLIEVETLRGCIQLKARVTAKIRPGLVGVLHGWEEANVNLLTDHLHGDPIFACPPVRAALCRIRKHV